ncbi:MAG TPA: RHS repeat-associated core domain-containing protein [Tahibacter sp.]|nr:RHS repeat-associated core domain-containing protein [Tahibacter sp.]
MGINNRLFRVVARAMVGVAMLLGGTAHASVKLPNGEYRETVTDLRVKVLGGYVAVERTWIADKLNKGQYRWYFNPAWADLSFEYDAIDDSVKSVMRADSKFERAGNDVFVFDRVFFIAKENGGWRWYDREGNWIRYDDAGRIAAYGDRNNVAVRFERNGPGRQISGVLDHGGAVALTFAYEGSRVASITDRTGRVVRYRYTGDDLTEVVDVAGNSAGYAYSNGLMTSKTDAEQRRTTIAYAGNRVVRVTDPLEHATTWEYAYDRGKRQYTIVEKSAEARRVERRYGADGQLLRELHGTREVFSLRRDGDYVRFLTDERGLVSRVEYDASFNLVKLSYADGTVASAKYDLKLGVPLEAVDELGRKTRYDYDARGNLTALTEAIGTAVQRVTTFRYDAHGQPESKTVEGADDSLDATTLYRYDDYGNVERVIDAEGHAVQMTHDVMGNVVTRTDARGKTWTAAYDAHGRIKSSSDPLSNTVRYDYDNVGQLRKRTDAVQKATIYEYYDDGRLRAATDPAGATMALVYDADGNATKMTDPSGVATQYGYDADGRFVAATDAAGNVVAFDYDVGGAYAGLIKRTRFPTYCEDYQYDQRRRITRVTRWLPCEGSDRRSETETAGYDAVGNVVSRTDEKQATTLFEYDALNRVDAATDALAGRSAFFHDAFNHVVSAKNANGNVQRYHYDRNGRLVAEVRALGGTIRYAYDPVGNLAQRTSAGGERRVYGYDDAGRRTDEQFYAASGGAPVQRVRYGYDPRGLLVSYTQSGDTASAAIYTYDDAGRLLDESVTYGSGSAAFTRTIATGYHPNGRKRSFTYPDQTRVEFTYTTDDLLHSVGLPGGGMIEWSDFEWFDAKRVTAPGVVRSLEFDPLQRPLRIAVQAIAGGTPDAPVGALLSDERYRYDAVGNPLERTTGDGAYAYAYDALDRLTEATPPAPLRGPDGLPTERYAYDGTHNRTSSAAQPGAWHYNADNELLACGLGAEQVRYTYDANGHVSGTIRGDAQAPVEMTESVYNAAERVAEIRRNGVAVGRYQYDPFGRRIRKETAQGIVWYQYASEGLVAEYSDNGSIETIYGWQPGGAWSTSPLWMAQRQDNAWRTFVYHTDSVGQPQRMTDASGGVVWSGLAEAFGQTRVSSSSRVVNPWRLPGQYFDEESGLHNNYMRDYDPRTGRYRQSDPLGLSSGPNAYAYVSAKPFVFIDPLGLAETGTYDVNLLNHSDKGWPKSQNATNNPNTLSVIGHGCENGKCVYNAKNSSLSAKKLAEIIRTTTDFNENPREIDLHVCWAGKGENPLALQLSEILRVRVNGPTREGQIWSDGHYTPKSPGEQKTFQSPIIVVPEKIPLPPMRVEI